jgi:hypothetical protein
MSGAISSLPQYAFMALCLVKKHRDNFTFTLWSSELEKPIAIKIVLIFPNFYGTQIFIEVFK